MAAQGAEIAFHQFPTRALSAAVMAVPVVAAAYAGSPFFDLLVVGGAGVLAWEWSRMCDAGAGAGRLRRPRLWVGAGIPYIVLPSLALLWLRHDPEHGRWLVLWLLATVWAADTGAYIAGRAIGGPKLAPAISPNKTWAGLAGGIAAALLVGVLAGQETGLGGGRFAAESALVGLTSQGGDLLESWVKRRVGVKDASGLIPGHGGLFDRVDGLLAAAVAVASVGLFTERGAVAWP